jgi:8-oxo-dGTP pyrophosphatase MutT (NUDIX family)
VPAAVGLVLVGDDHEEACFLITRRARGMRNHAGQWALPGGRIDPGEDPTAAALRETEEELGLALDRPRVLGLLDDYPTRSGFRITPVVIWAGPHPALVPNPDEVAEVHRIPLAVLERPEVPHLREIDESDRPVISVPIPMLNTNIHAPTAAVLYQLREVALRGRRTRVDHFEQPVFAWR